MKKIIFAFLVLFNSLCAYAEPSIDLDGLSVVNLSSYPGSQVKIYGHSSGTYSEGICRIIFRSDRGYMLDDFNKLAQRFKFIRGRLGQETQVAPIVTFYSLQFTLLKNTDFSNEYIIMTSRNGKSIGENITEVFGQNPIAVLAGTCYQPNK